MFPGYSPAQVLLLTRLNNAQDTNRLGLKQIQRDTTRYNETQRDTTRYYEIQSTNTVPNNSYRF